MSIQCKLLLILTILGGVGCARPYRVTILTQSSDYHCEVMNGQRIRVSECETILAPPEWQSAE